MRRTHVVAALLVLAIGLLAGGCLDGTDQTATPDKVVGEVPVATTDTEALPALELTGDPEAGKAVFTGASSCGGCHTLAAAGASGAVGPNLDETKPDNELIVSRVTEGLGGMPAFGEQLTPQQIADVAAYITQSTGG
jgi:mono/diheme cytochrome c family protein